MLNKVNRASQFMPFDALSGFYETLREAEKQIEEKKSLAIDQEEILNRQLQQIQVGDLLEVSFYYQVEYIKVVGFLKKIHLSHKWMIVANTKIDLENIICLKILEKKGKMCYNYIHEGNTLIR